MQADVAEEVLGAVALGDAGEGDEAHRPSFGRQSAHGGGRREVSNRSRVAMPGDARRVPRLLDGVGAGRRVADREDARPGAREAGAGGAALIGELDQLGRAGQEGQAVRLVQLVAHRVAQQARVGGHDRGRQQRAAARLPRGRRVRHGLPAGPPASPRSGSRAAAMKATGIQASGTRKRRSVERSSSRRHGEGESRRTAPPPRCRGGPPAGPRGRAARRPRRCRRPTAAPSSTPGDDRRGAAARARAPPGSCWRPRSATPRPRAPTPTRSPSRKARMSRFSPAGSSSDAAPPRRER